MKAKTNVSVAEIRKMTAAMVSTMDIKFRMFSMSPDLQMAFAVDNDALPIAVASPAWKCLLGYSCRELEGKAYKELLHPDDYAELSAKIAEALDNGHTIGLLRNRLIDNDGNYVTIDWNISEPVDKCCYAVGRVVTNG